MSAKKKTAAKRTVRTTRTKPKKKASPKRKTTKKSAVKKKSTAKTKPAARRKSPAKKKSAGKAALGRPRIAGTAELDLMFRNDREAREICEFLGVKTLKELETLSPEEIVDRLSAPVVRTVGRIRKALAMNNRCLAGDQKFALAFKKELG